MRRRDNGISNDKNKNNNKARARPKTSTSRGGFTTVPTYTNTYKLIMLIILIYYGTTNSTNEQ